MLNPTTALGVLIACAVLQAGMAKRMGTNMIVERSFQSQKHYDNPFMSVEVDVVFTGPDGMELKMPAFWAGADMWKIRYASPQAQFAPGAASCYTVSRSVGICPHEDILIFLRHLSKNGGKLNMRGLWERILVLIFFDIVIIIT